MNTVTKNSEWVKRLGRWVLLAMLSAAANPGPAAVNYALVSSYVGNTVECYDTNGTWVSTFVSGLANPGGLAFSPDNKIWIPNAVSSGSINRYDLYGNLVDQITGLSFPQAVTFGPDGNAYVLERYALRVTKFNGTTGANLGLFATNHGGEVNSTWDMAFGTDSNLYVYGRGTNNASGIVQRFNGTNGAWIDDFATIGAYASGGIGFARGNLYLSSVGEYKVYCFDATTGARKSSGDITGLDVKPWGLTPGSDDALYVVGYTGNKVVRRSGANFATSANFATNHLTNPTHLIFAPVVPYSQTALKQECLVASYGNSRVERFSTNGTWLGTFIDPFQNPSGMAISPDRRVWVASCTGGYLRRYSLKGTYIDQVYASLNTAETVTFGPDGNAYVLERYTMRVLKFDGTTGAYLGVFATNHNATVTSTWKMSFGPDGHLYVNGRRNDYGGVLQRFDGATGAWIDDFATLPANAHPVGPLMFTRNNLFWGANRTIYCFNAETGARRSAGDIAGTPSLVKYGVVGPDNALYVTFGSSITETNNQAVCYSGANFSSAANFITNYVDNPQGIVFIPPAPQGTVLCLR
ncbi:MAG: hypothetical protein PHR35_06255 [Kiritimatiellae bacterium]|nr:hypothetical protein [Kiritimatiellia bacterium]